MGINSENEKLFNQIYVYNVILGIYFCVGRMGKCMLLEEKRMKMIHSHLLNT